MSALIVGKVLRNRQENSVLTLRELQLRLNVVCLASRLLPVAVLMLFDWQSSCQMCCDSDRGVGNRSSAITKGLKVDAALTVAFPYLRYKLTRMHNGLFEGLFGWVWFSIRQLLLSKAKN